MANNTYVVDTLAPVGPTVTVSDDGIGNDDLLTINGIYDGVSPNQTVVWTLAWGDQFHASATYDTDPSNTVANTGRLVVNGAIENIRGSNGRDFMVGNALVNTLFGDHAATGPGGKDTINGEEGNDLIYGGAGNDIISGGEDDDRLFGNLGADNISGGSGVDLVEGGAGADILSGGANIGDRVSYVSSNAAVTIRIAHGATTNGVGGDAQGDTINGFTQVVGSAFGDTLIDTVKSKIAFNYNDNDFMGGGGNDQMWLGGGDDAGLGQTGNDTIRGEGGDDRLDGATGLDRLFGGAGADRLIGGLGADRFIYTRLSDSANTVAGRDVIDDFRRGQGDKIDLHTIDARADLAGNNTFSFIGAGAFTGVDGQLRFVKVDFHTVIYADTNGDKQPDFSIQLFDAITPIASDFIL